MEDMQERWHQLTPFERREERFKNWLAPKRIIFESKEAEELYRIRAKRLIDAVKLNKPDRIAAAFNPGYLPAFYSGYTIKEVMYDANKLADAWRRFAREIELDVLPNAAMVRCGKAMDLAGYNMYVWPGQGLPDNTSMQYIDAEYLFSDEWSRFNNDPTDFQFRIYLTRLYKSAAPLKNLPNLKSIGSTISSLAVFSDSEIISALKKLGQAGKEEQEWRQKIRALDGEAMSKGLPTFYVGTSTGLAPLDFIGANLRGTKGTMMDMFRQPDVLLEMMDKLVSQIVSRGVALANQLETPFVFMPLHRGADNFMSEKQFLTFYWPYLKRVILGFVEEGLVPRLFAEGGFASRLEIVKELPKGSVIWHFDQTDMVQAKSVFQSKFCLMGNVPVSLLITGTPDQVKTHCRNLIENVGKDGGFILAPSATSDNTKLENLMAMVDAAKTYGRFN